MLTTVFVYALSHLFIQLFHFYSLFIVIYFLSHIFICVGLVNEIALL